MALSMVIATAISLMQLLRRPLLLEGEAGVGKTEVAKALAKVRATELIRLQCYEGLDQSSALYEWNYQRQLLAQARLHESQQPLVEHVQPAQQRPAQQKHGIQQDVRCQQLVGAPVGHGHRSGIHAHDHLADRS